MTKFLRVVMYLVAQLCPTLCNPMDCSPPGSSVHRLSKKKNTGVGSHSLLQGIFLTQGSNLSLLHCRQIPYQELAQPDKKIAQNPSLSDCLPNSCHKGRDQALKTQEKYLRRAGRTFTFQRHKEKNASSSIADFFFPLKVRILKKYSIKPAFFSCAHKNIIWVCQKSFNLAIFIVRCPLICNKASTCKYKFYTYMIKSSQCISTEDNSQCLSIEQKFLSVFHPGISS